MLRPRSILQLVLMGFGVVTIPLLAAFIATALLVRDLSETGQQAILGAADVVQESRTLVEQATAMERNGRQYLVLEDPALLEVYLQRRTQFREAAAALRVLELTELQRSLLSELENLEGDLFRRLNPRTAEATATGFDPREFAALTSLARGVLGESGQLITANIAELNANANRVQRLLLWETVALIPLALALGGVCVVLIIRPFRTLNAVINNLGAGKFDEAVTVRGPRDLQKLGAQLEWMRRRLQELENQKVLFLRNISHELKTPLTTMREGTQLLGEQIVGNLNPEQREIVTLLSENSIQLQRLIEDLLHFSISQTASLHIEPKPVALERLVGQLLAEQRLIVQAKRLSIETELAPIVVQGDGMKLKAVFGNLISNAIKYSPPDSPIRITLSARAPWAVFEVRDCGPGIGHEERKRVFEAFYQGRAKYEGHVKGSGLGLSIAREFVRLHEGTIDVLDSTQGAHLRVCLPLAASDTSAQEDPAEPGTAEPGTGTDDRLQSGQGVGADAGGVAVATADTRHRNADGARDPHYPDAAGARGAH